jgi:hypothetical protein
MRERGRPGLRMKEGAVMFLSPPRRPARPRNTSIRGGTMCCSAMASFPSRSAKRSALGCTAVRGSRFARSVGQEGVHLGQSKPRPLCGSFSCLPGTAGRGRRPPGPWLRRSRLGAGRGYPPTPAEGSVGRGVSPARSRHHLSAPPDEERRARPARPESEDGRGLALDNRLCDPAGLWRVLPGQLLQLGLYRLIGTVYPLEDRVQLLAAYRYALLNRAKGMDSKLSRSSRYWHQASTTPSSAVASPDRAPPLAAHFNTLHGWRENARHGTGLQAPFDCVTFPQNSLHFASQLRRCPVKSGRITGAS